MNPTDPAYPALSYWRPTTNEADDDAMVRDGPTGFCARAYAAIRLRVPRSGIGWLDDMIREAQLNEFAGQALLGVTLHWQKFCEDNFDDPSLERSSADWHRRCAIQAFQYADAMQAESNRRKEGPK